MATIGIIDDRESDRKEVAERISLETSDEGWEVIEGDPFLELQDYLTWIAENDVNVLIVDELFEVLINGIASNHQGHDVVSFVRSHMPSLPIFVITAHNDEQHLQERYKDIEEIIIRTEFSREPTKFIPKIVRSAQNFITAFESELNELSQFAQKAAAGSQIDDDELKRVEAIRQHLGIAFPAASISDINTWINEAAKLVDKLEKLRVEIEERASRSR